MGTQLSPPNSDYTLSEMLTEAQLIERVRRALPTSVGAGSGLRVGIGDDAAIWRPARGRDGVVTCDAFLEGVHFLPGVHPPEVVGYKALARAASDLAAMGARPRFFLLTLALSPERTGAWLEGFLRGMARAARRFGLQLAGGDTSRQPSVAISITVFGEIAPGQAVLRSGARPGEIVCVSGRLGAAQLGLELLLQGWHRRPRWRRYLRAHFYPALRLKLGQFLAARNIACAMIDTSDGLSTDLGHICDASGVGARLWADRIPGVAVPAELQRRGLDPLEMALHGGEDYELLFTVPRAMFHRLGRQLQRRVPGVRITAIGEITKRRGVFLLRGDARAIPLPPRGWDPFRRR